MEEIDLQAAWNSPESEHVERKENYALENIRKTICAFANDLSRSGKPGVIFIGQKDDRTCANLTFDDKMNAALAQQDNFVTLPAISIKQVNFDNCNATAVIVYPAQSVPVRYNSAIYVRIGSATVKASYEQELRLLEKQKSNTKSFELWSVNDAELDDLDLTRFQIELLPQLIDQETIEANGRTINQWLQTVHFLTSENHPTNLGMLSIAKEVQSWLPGAYIDAARINGVEFDAENIAFRQTISGHVFDQFREVEKLIPLFVSTHYDMSEFKRKTLNSIPINAVREAIANAIIHRTYQGTNAPIDFRWFDDRIEIRSPGGPYGQVTAENIKQGVVRDYRNPELAGILKRIGLVEMFGSGIRRIRREMEKNGNNEPIFDANDQAVTVILPLLNPK